MKSRHSLFVIVLLSFFLLVSVSSTLNEGITPDEFPHLAAGFSYLKAFDYRLNPEHPPLVKLLSAFPLLFTDLELPDDWRTMKQYELSRELFHNGNLRFYFLISRIPNMILGVLLGLVIYLFARDLFGKKAGLLALFMYSFSPLMLAHSRYVTTDIGMTLFMTATLHSLWGYFTKKNRRDLYLASVFIGFCAASKYSSAYFAGIVIILFAVYAYKDKKKFHMQYVKDLVVLGGISFVVLMSTYGFVNFFSYIDGLMTVFDQASGRRHFILGENYIGGAWYYFPLAFLFKTPLATLGLVGLTLFLYHNQKKDYKKELILIIPALLYLLLFMRGQINIGVRHIMPIYPLLFIFSSRLIEMKQAWVKKSVYVLCGILALSSILTFPHYLSFFNEVIPDDRAHEYLIDSNIDWGQGLVRLNTWLDENGISEPVYFAYQGLDNATINGFDTRKPVCFPQNGYHVVSVNFYQNIFQEDPHCMGWVKELQPIARPDPSLFVFHVTNAQSAEIEAQPYCDSFCQVQCPRAKMVFKSSRYEGGCKCRCLGSQPRS